MREGVSQSAESILARLLLLRLRLKLRKNGKRPGFSSAGGVSVAWSWFLRPRLTLLFLAKGFRRTNTASEAGVFASSSLEPSSHTLCVSVAMEPLRDDMEGLWSRLISEAEGWWYRCSNDLFISSETSGKSCTAISLTGLTRWLFSLFSRSTAGMGFRSFLLVFPLCSEPTDAIDVGRDSLEAIPRVGRLNRFNAVFSRNPDKGFFPFSVFGDDGDIGDIGEIGGVDSAKVFFVERNSLNV